MLDTITNFGITRTFHNVNVVGTCGKCGGPVVIPAVWSGEEPTPYCEDCGATAKKDIRPVWGPIVEMK